MTDFTSPESSSTTPASDSNPQQLDPPAWTPLEDSNPPRKRPWGLVLGLLLLLGIGGTFGWRWWQGQHSAPAAGGPPPGQPQGLPVQVATVETRLLQETSVFVGTLEAKQTVEVRSEADGTIEAIFVEPGQTVLKGTRLMKINPAKQQAALAADVAGLQAAQATQDSAEAELEALKAERVSQEAELKLQEQEFQRISGLVTEGALERQRLDQVSRDRTQAAADLTAIDRRIQAAQAQLAQAKRVVQQNQAQASLVQENLQDTDVTAPFDGVVGDIPLRVGSYVERSDFLTQLVQNSVLELRLFIPLEQIDQLQLDLPVQVQNSAEQPIATGRITFISPQVDTNSQTVLAKATFDNLSDNLRDQQFVRAIVIWSQKGNAVMIPTNALVLQGDDRFVYGVKGKDPFLATLKPVQVGEMKTDQVEILSGLNPGEQIIISGKQKIFDGAPIVPLPNP